MDLTKLPLTPLEGFVLSRVDGTANIAVLADLTNLDEESVEQIIDKLIALDVVEWARESVSLPRATGRPATRTPAVITVPDSLRAPPAGSDRPPPPRGGVVRMRPRSSPSTPSEESSQGMYRGSASSEERVDPGRRSAFPPSSPRASHTGSIFPAGELEEHDGEPADPSARAPEELGEPEEDVATAPTMRPPADPDPAAPESSSPSEADGSDPANQLAAEADWLLEEATALTSGEWSAVGGKESADAPSNAASEPPPASEGRSAAPSRPPSAAPSEAPPGPSSRPPSEPPSAEPSAEAPAELLPDPDPEDPPFEAAADEPGPPGDEPAEAAVEEEEEEELDLAPERRKRIDDLYYALDLLDHYQVLGVGREVDRKEVRTAYFQLSKIFHPDTMFRKRLGSYKGKMEGIFHRLTEAYEVLGKKRARQEYDRYLSLQDQTRAVEAVISTADEEAAEAEERGKEAARREADLAAGRQAEKEAAAKAEEEPTESPQEPAPSARASSRASMSAAGKANARELMAQKLRRAANASSSRRSKNVRDPNPLSSDPPAPRDRKEVLRSLASSLKATASHTGGLDPVLRHVRTAERAEKEGDLAKAAGELRTAMMLAPEREDLRERHARVNAELSSSLSMTYEEQALYEQRHGKWGAAALSWSKVVEGRPDDARAARHAAEALIEAKGDLHKAQQLAQQAAELEPDDIGNLRALARVYIAAKLPLNARRVLQRAASLDPDDELVENLLRDLDA